MKISRAYDPRITCMDGQYYVCFAVDTRHGVRGGIFSTHDFHHFAPISLSVPDNRNMVLFPEKIGGKYVRLERPMPVYSTGGISSIFGCPIRRISRTGAIPAWCSVAGMYPSATTRSALARRRSRPTQAGW